MNYPYANGTIKALEEKVLDRNKLFVLNKYEKNEFVKVLLAMNYGESGETIEELINNEHQKTKDLINSITPKKEDTDLFYLVNDAQNIKILYKIKKYNIDKKDLLTNSGSMNSENLSEAILDNNFDNVSKNVKKLIEKLNKVVETIDSAKLLSATIDNTIYGYALKTTSNNILKQYLTTKIDLTNVMSMYRAQNLNWSFDEYRQMFLSHGTIKIEVFESIYSKDKSLQIKALEPYYNEKISKLLQKISSVDECQIEFERLTLEIMSEHKNDPFNIGPMIYYYLLKEAEAQNIRILYSLKKVDIKNLI